MTRRTPWWIDRLARRNPPEPADLDRAWRITLVQARLTAAVLALCFVPALLLIISPDSAVIEATLGAATALGCLAMCAYLLLRPKSWLNRAIAVAGTRPDIGYPGFARIPAIHRITWLHRAFWTLMVLYAIANTALSLDLSVSAHLREAGALGYLLGGGYGAAKYLSLQATARRDFDRMLAEGPRSAA